jgi:hypothetical protein
MSQTEEEARKFWADLQERSTGTMHVEEWRYLWIASMLHRWVAQHSWSELIRFRGRAGWEKIVGGARLCCGPRNT